MSGVHHKIQIVACVTAGMGPNTSTPQKVYRIASFLHGVLIFAFS